MKREIYHFSQEVNKSGNVLNFLIHSFTTPSISDTSSLCDNQWIEISDALYFYKMGHFLTKGLDQCGHIQHFCFLFAADALSHIAASNIQEFWINGTI